MFFLSFYCRLKVEKGSKTSNDSSGPSMPDGKTPKDFDSHLPKPDQEHPEIKKELDDSNIG